MTAGAAPSHPHFGVYLSGSISLRNTGGQVGREVWTPGREATGLFSLRSIFLSSSSSVGHVFIGLNVCSLPILLLREEEQEGAGQPSAGWLLSIPMLTSIDGHWPPQFRENRFGADAGLCIAAEFPEVIVFGHSVTSTNKRKHNYSHSPVGYRGN